MLSASDVLLRLKNLSVTYNPESSPVDALKDISFDLSRGEGIGLIGESGCGKSTLALQLLGLLKNVAVSGEIVFADQNLLAMDDRALNRVRWKKIAISFQNSLEVFNPVVSIKVQIAEAIKRHNAMTSAEITIKVDHLLDSVGLNRSWGACYPHQLSGGMRQKVILAMAIACDPDLLILDEPTTALDAQSKTELIGFLKALKEERGVALITISHDLEVIQALSSRLYVMYKGRIIETGPTKSVIEEPLHTYTRGFLNSSPILFQYKDLWGIRSEAEETPESGGCAFHGRCPQGTDSCAQSLPVLQEVSSGRSVACHKGGIEILLKAFDIHKIYSVGRKKITALKGVDIVLKSGEIVALVGESGSGKSTLARVLCELEKADSGSMFFLERPIKDRWSTKMMGGMQIVFQDPISSTNHRMKVLEVVKEPLEIIRAGNRTEKKERAVSVLQMVQLPTTESFLERYCFSLSGGQRQRLSIARALITTPRLLIADEITSMLDPSTQANLLRELKAIQNNNGFTMLYITHDLHMARKIADRIYVLYQGEIIESGMASSIFNNPQCTYTQELLKNVAH